jgi:RAB protein geranylgeranyltransferase component A
MFAWISKYGLEDDTVDFIGHALALHRDDNYLDEPAIDTVKRMKVLYFHPTKQKTLLDSAFIWIRIAQSCIAEFCMTI